MVKMQKLPFHLPFVMEANGPFAPPWKNANSQRQKQFLQPYLRDPKLLIGRAVFLPLDVYYPFTHGKLTPNGKS